MTTTTIEAETERIIAHYDQHLDDARLAARGEQRPENVGIFLYCVAQTDGLLTDISETSPAWEEAGRHYLAQFPNTRRGR